MRRTCRDNPGPIHFFKSSLEVVEFGAGFTKLSFRCQSAVIRKCLVGAIDQPESAAKVVPIWHYERSISFYGPGFYGHRTACGVAYTTDLMGVAHRSLPCGTLVTFRNPSNGLTITVPVVDRGPYVSGRNWDLTGAACIALHHCWTGAIYWKFP